MFWTWFLPFLCVIALCVWFLWIHSAPILTSDQDVLIILGYKTLGNEPHPLLNERLAAAVHLLQTYHFKRVIVSGGAIGGSKPEAEIMKELLVEARIDENLILLEKESRDTIENLLFSKQLMEQEGLQTCLIVSNSFHIRRIQMIGRRMGLTALYFAKRSWKTPFEQFINTLNEMKAFRTTLAILTSRFPNRNSIQ